MAEYRLSCEVLGHSADVRVVRSFTVCGEQRDRLVTASRDGTACVWAEEASSNNYVLKKLFQKHTGYVSSVCIIPKDGREETLIATGGQDKTILVHSLDENVKEPLERYTGHTDLITCIIYQHNQLISASWDGTIKLWRSCQNSETITAHKPAVWAIDGLYAHDGSRRVLSCGADRTIKLWELDTKLCLLEYKGHTDVVRDVKVASCDTFLSASNDCTIRRWSIHTGICLNEMYGHSAFVYSIALFPGFEGANFISGGEDGTLRVWEGSICKQVLQLPANSVWSVCCMSNGDITCGSSDSVARVFTAVDQRVASPEVLANFLTAVENHKAASTQNNIDVSTLPGLEALNRIGTKHGDTQMINNGGIPEVYQWNEITQQWEKIGNAISKAPEKSAVYEGKEYDYVFDIELDEGSPVMRKLKLPYNKNVDPYIAADDFLNANELPPCYLDQVAEFIIQNAGEYHDERANTDPFTGGSRYIPGSDTQRTASGPGYDPFTGASRYVPGAPTVSGFATATDSLHSTQGADPFTGRSSYRPSIGGESSKKVCLTTDEKNTFFPTVDYQTFSSSSEYWDKVIGKIKEFNCNMTDEWKLQEWQIEKMQDFCTQLSVNPVAVFRADHIQFLQVLLGWPYDKLLPGLDILRVAVLNNSASSYLFSSSDTGEAFFNQLLDYAFCDNADRKNQLLVLRCIANMFVQPPCLSLVNLKRTTVLSQVLQLLPASSKLCQVAVATIVQNYCHYCYIKHNVDAIPDCAQACVKILDTNVDAEAKLRVAIGFGTLMSVDIASVKQSGGPFDLLSIFQPLCHIVDQPKLSQCAGFILQALK